MNSDLAAALAKLESEFVPLDARHAELMAVHASLAAQIAPLVARQREIEAEIDDIRPRRAALAVAMAAQVEHLRKAVG